LELASTEEVQPRSVAEVKRTADGRSSGPGRAVDKGQHKQSCKCTEHDNEFRSAGMCDDAANCRKAENDNVRASRDPAQSGPRVGAMKEIEGSSLSHSDARAEEPDLGEGARGGQSKCGGHVKNGERGEKPSQHRVGSAQEHRLGLHLRCPAA
jgi:hypothetical protein